jgi:hypothetical protein
MARALRALVSGPRDGLFPVQQDTIANCHDTFSPGPAQLL